MRSRSDRHRHGPNPARGRHELRRWRPHATLRILTPIPSPAALARLLASSWGAVHPLAACLLILAGSVRAEEWRTFVTAPPEPRPVAVVVEAEVPVVVPEVLPAEPEPLDVAAAGPALPECQTCPVEAQLTAAAEPDAKGPCAEDAAECRDALQKLRDDPLPKIDLDIRVGGRAGSDYPCECRLEGETFQPRRFAATMFTWKAAGYCHKPLYFEDWSLERYGHSHGFVADSFTSAAHFFTTLPVLPYKMGVELPWECVYPLGYYRPGSCAPWTIPAVPISARGFAVEAATITGLVFLLP